EAARLFAVAIDGDGATSQSLSDEGRDDHAVLAGLARADGVEETDDDGGPFPLAPVGEREELINRLRAGVRPTPLRCRAHDEVAVFAERHLLREAIDFRSRSDEHLLLLLVGE